MTKMLHYYDTEAKKYLPLTPKGNSEVYGRVKIADKLEDIEEKTASDSIVPSGKIVSLLEEEINGLQEEIENLQDKDAEQISNIKALQSKDTELENGIKTLQSKDAGLESNINALQNKDTELKNSIDALQNKDTELENNIKALQSKDTELENSIKVLQNEDTGLKNSIDALQNEDTGLKNSINALQNKDTELESSINSIDSKIKKGELSVNSLIVPPGGVGGAINPIYLNSEGKPTVCDLSLHAATTPTKTENNNISFPTEASIVTDIGVSDSGHVTSVSVGNFSIEEAGDETFGLAKTGGDLIFKDGMGSIKEEVVLKSPKFIETINGSEKEYDFIRKDGDTIEDNSTFLGKYTVAGNTKEMHLFSWNRIFESQEIGDKNCDLFVSAKNARIEGVNTAALAANDTYIEGTRAVTIVAGSPEGVTDYFRVQPSKAVLSNQNANSLTLCYDGLLMSPSSERNDFEFKFKDDKLSTNLPIESHCATYGPLKQDTSLPTSSIAGIAVNNNEKKMVFERENGTGNIDNFCYPLGNYNSTHSPGNRGFYIVRTGKVLVSGQIFFNNVSKEDASLYAGIKVARLNAEGLYEDNTVGTFPLTIGNSNSLKECLIQIPPRVVTVNRGDVLQIACKTADSGVTASINSGISKKTIDGNSSWETSYLRQRTYITIQWIR